VIHSADHPALISGWMALGVVGAVLPLVRRRTWIGPTRNAHLVMTAVMIAMLIPAAPWWAFALAAVASAAIAGELFASAHRSPECVPCAYDGVAMSLMLMVTATMALTTIGGNGHAGQSFPLLGAQIGVCWIAAAWWSRKHAGLATRHSAGPARSWSAPRLSAVGSVLMAGSMSAMMVTAM
jgi:Domain of unknown function (DUF5134)